MPTRREFANSKCLDGKILWDLNGIAAAQWKIYYDAAAAQWQKPLQRTQSVPPPEGGSSP